MQSTPQTIPTAVKSFRTLHQSGCFVLPNPWDKGTAVYFQKMGYKALATTSAGLGFSQATPDGVGYINLEQTLAHIREIVQATALPVNADLQEGFATAPEAVAANVTSCVGTGVAGLSIEDATGDETQPLFQRELAIERIQASREAIDKTGIPVVLTGRCEAWLVGDPTPFETALDRLVAYAEAGADCLYAPGVRDPAQIEALVKAVHPKPINILVSSPEPGLTVPKLAAMGVRRISVGSGMARVAWGALMRASEALLKDGSFEGFADAASFATLNQLFKIP